jgi:hypothetical protein
MSVYQNSGFVTEKNKMCYEKQMPRTRQILEVAIIVKIQGQDFKIYGSNIKVLTQVTCI